MGCLRLKHTQEEQNHAPNIRIVHFAPNSTPVATPETPPKIAIVPKKPTKIPLLRNKAHSFGLQSYRNGNHH